MGGAGWAEVKVSGGCRKVQELGGSAAALSRGLRWIQCPKRELYLPHASKIYGFFYSLYVRSQNCWLLFPLRPQLGPTTWERATLCYSPSTK